MWLPALQMTARVSGMIANGHRDSVCHEITLYHQEYTKYSTGANLSGDYASCFSADNLVLTSVTCPSYCCISVYAGSKVKWQMFLLNVHSQTENKCFSLKINNRSRTKKWHKMICNLSESELTWPAVTRNHRLKVTNRLNCFEVITSQ